MTRRAKELGLPLEPASLLSPRGGQVQGLGRQRVQSILSDHGIHRVLAHEAGRTSRGSIDNMRAYVDWLNAANAETPLSADSIEDIEAWWIQRVKAFFASQPFVLRIDSAKSLAAIVRDLLDQAQKRQDESPGSRFVGTVLQHLIGAKLGVLLKDETIEHRGASVADEPSGTPGDYLVGDVAIHVTTAPSEALIAKCARNLEQGLRPLIVTLTRGVAVAEELAKQSAIDERLDVLDAEQFLVADLYELGRFGAEGRKSIAQSIVERYNAIIDSVETDPSLRIRLSQNNERHHFRRAAQLDHAQGAEQGYPA